MASRIAKGKGAVEFVMPPDTLRAKVPAEGPGGVDAETLARAEAVIASMSGEYLEWVEDDLDAIEKVLRDLKVAAEPDRMHHIGRLFQLAHDIKGQGGSFGYDLMTLIADQLCRFIETVEAPGATALEVIQLHVAALRVVIANRLEGDGGNEGRKLYGDLRKVVKKLGG